MTEWTEGQIARLVELHQTLSSAEIGLRLGMSKNAVVSKRRRLGLPAREAPPAADTKARQHIRTRPPVPTLASLVAIVTVPVAPERPEPRVVTRTACQYPMNDSRPWRFCEAVSQLGSVYCAKHHSICYSKAASWWAA